jgi:glyoxylase-like metal-dependent hydrolase (beta-lactamase superfamily II)
LPARNTQREKVSRAPGAPTIEPVAAGVWLVRGGLPRTMNVYLLEDEGGVTLFDAGIKTMAGGLRQASERFGGIRRTVLGHGHTDHRGAAPKLGAPVFCHPDEVLDAEGSGGFRYWPELRHSSLPRSARLLHPLFHRYLWDGGPVKIEGTVSEGDDVAGFRVIHAPGHAPGLIVLWREQDRLALGTDLIYRIDMMGRDSEPHMPDDTYNWDSAMARESARKIAELDPVALWLGHGSPVEGDVAAALRRAADSG